MIFPGCVCSPGYPVIFSQLDPAYYPLPIGTSKEIPEIPQHIFFAAPVRLVEAGVCPNNLGPLHRAGGLVLRRRITLLIEGVFGKVQAAEVVEVVEAVVVNEVEVVEVVEAVQGLFYISLI